MSRLKPLHIFYPEKKTFVQVVKELLHFMELYDNYRVHKSHPRFLLRAS
jgi:hypothetical protein